MNNFKSQRIFYDSLTEKKLNELLNRSDESTRIMETHINNLLSPFALLSSVRVKSPESHCDIIINYFDNNQNIGHFTIHLKMDDSSMIPYKRKNGRIHMKTKNTCYTMKCNKRKINDANNSVSIYYSKSEKYIKPNVSKCLDATLSVLNEYMDFNSNLSLDISMTPKHINPCATKRNQFRHTRKASKHAKIS